MRIGIVASIWISVPPKNFGFGAQELIAYYIADSLIKKGHEVTLFASGDSQTAARLISACPEQISGVDFPDKKIKDMFELVNVSHAYKNSGDFDIIHNHLLPYGLLFSELVITPTIHTLHHAIYPDRAGIFLYKKYRNQQFISISDSQRKTLPELNYISTVYNGIDTSQYAFKESPSGNYMLYIGRIKRYKGIHTAIKLSHELGLDLKIAGPLPYKNQSDYDEVMEYWEKEIKPYLGNRIEHFDTLGYEDKVSLIQDAKLLIFPVEREEPFGMTIIEAMSCGTPVVAFANGAIPELITDGKSGFLINMAENNHTTRKITVTSYEGLVQAIKTIYSFSELEYKEMRRNSRNHVLNHFTVEKMVEGYEKAYKHALSLS